ncbi:glycosyltransferase [Deinococcus ruber]|uniref:Glycosyl transferase n=1 Tax=Deinococcus ruber TaxID=1848197 RepID=A0A918CIC0_9DEIO|nr:glycosyltransferase [Deinococcus ruber]GGR25915.1 glycosyl transferase [Deinococcus ruber]
MYWSVVIPARNEEETLPALLAALHAQTRRADEIIVVDNGSSDRTAEVAAALGARVLHCPEPGVARARQLGLEHARGDWIASTDADSQPEPEWLAALERGIREVPGSVALYGPMQLLPLAGRVGPLGARLSGVGYRVFLGVMAALGQPNCAGANMAFSRQAALMVGGWPLVEAREDVLLGMALRRLGTVRYLPDAAVHTSARRLKRGWGPFLWTHIRNLAGHTSGYFDR